MIKKTAFGMMIFMQVLPLNGYIYNAVILRKWHEDLNRYHYFIGLGDFHHKNHPANKQHLTDLRELFAGAKKDSFKILTEDLSVANDLGRSVVKGFSVNSRGGLLGGLTEVCRGIGLDTENLEHRYARVCALGPVLNNLKKDPYAASSPHRLTVGDLIDEIYTEIKRITLYEDGPALQEWYRACIQKTEKKMTSYNLLPYKDQPVASYLQKMPEPLRTGLPKLLTFDAALLDIKIVHAVVQYAHKEYTCAVAGGSHIDRASNALKRIGYSQIWQAKVRGSLANVGDLESCDCVPNVCSAGPAPISLHGLKRFF